MPCRLTRGTFIALICQTSPDVLLDSSEMSQTLRHFRPWITIHIIQYYRCTLALHNTVQ